MIQYYVEYISTINISIRPHDNIPSCTAIAERGIATIWQLCFTHRDPVKSTRPTACGVLSKPRLVSISTHCSVAPSENLPAIHLRFFTQAILLKVASLLVLAVTTDFDTVLQHLRYSAHQLRVGSVWVQPPACLGGQCEVMYCSVEHNRRTAPVHSAAARMT